MQESMGLVPRSRIKSRALIPCGMQMMRGKSAARQTSCRCYVHISGDFRLVRFQRGLVATMTNDATLNSSLPCTGWNWIPVWKAKQSVTTACVRISVTRSWEISQNWEIWGVHWDKILICWDIPKLGFFISSIKACKTAWKWTKVQLFWRLLTHL